ncbi:TauD/TfdA dioxygenase family protein [Streptomyces parvulus]|uniref:TauD/TfdA dioxygenase family protein n=1 Tax=Streptomyces parvulus TaxID=146923 RepID=UPI00342D9B9E
MEQYELDALEAVTSRPSPEYSTITVDALTPVIGAEVSGIDLSQELTDEQRADLHAAFLHHHVLIFRDQVITSDEHKRLAGYFGELRPVNPPPPGDPYLLEISTSKGAAEVAGNRWHSDGTADAEPSLGSMLYITRIPEAGSGGDTLFANMHLAYEMLSPAMRGFLDSLTAVHDGAHFKVKGYTLPPEYVVPVNEHPLVVRHPETGRKILYANGVYVSHIPQLSDEESRALLDLLNGIPSSRPLLHCRVRWTPNTLVFWDNRSAQHHASYDYYPFTRYGQRVAINGGPLKA